MVAGKGARPASADRRLRDLGIQLPAVPTPFGSYVETVQTGNRPLPERNASGGPIINRRILVDSRAILQLRLVEAQPIQQLWAPSPPLRNIWGTLDTITRIVRLGIFIATLDESINQPKIADAASDFFKEVFGIDKLAVRSVIGVASLPLNVPIVVEVIFEIAI